MTKRLMFVTDGMDSHSFNTLSALSKRASEMGHTAFIVDVMGFDMKDDAYRQAFLAEKFDVVVGYVSTDGWLSYLRRKRIPRIIFRDAQNIDGVNDIVVKHTNERILTNLCGIGKRTGVVNVPFFPSTWDYNTSMVYECACISKFPLSEGFGNCSKLYEDIINTTPRVSTFGKASYGQNYRGFVDSSTFRSIYHNSVTTLVNTTDSDYTLKAINSSVVDAIFGGSVALVERGRVWHPDVLELVEEFDSKVEFNELVNKYVTMFNDNNRAYCKIVDARMRKLNAIAEAVYETFFETVRCI